MFLKDFDHSQSMVIGVIGITGVNVLEHVALEFHFNLVYVTIHAHYMADITVWANGGDTGHVTQRYSTLTNPVRHKINLTFRNVT